MRLQGESTEMEKWRVLLVDDEPEFTAALAERLALRGMDARTAASGEEALKLLESGAPHVVVSDVMMPGLGGMELLKRIRKYYSGVQVILLTGMSCAFDTQEAERLGAFACLMKPLNIKELIEKIHEAVAAIAEQQH
jgi:DNA-binding NtrC family response regulator